MRRTALPRRGRQRLTPGLEGAGPPGARPFAFHPDEVWGPPVAATHDVVTTGKRGLSMPTWALILIIVLLVIVLFGGVGYGRRGNRV